MGDPRGDIHHEGGDEPRQIQALPSID